MKRLKYYISKKSGHSKGKIVTRHKQNMKKNNYISKLNIKNIVNTYSIFIKRLNHKYSVYYNSKGFLYIDNIVENHKKNSIIIASNNISWNYLFNGNYYIISVFKNKQKCNSIYNKKKKEVKGNIEILNTKNNSRIIKLPSKEIKMYSLFNISRTGVFEKKKIKLKKAGESRWLGNKFIC